MSFAGAFFYESDQPVIVVVDVGNGAILPVPLVFIREVHLRDVAMDRTLSGVQDVHRLNGVPCTEIRASLAVHARRRIRRQETSLFLFYWHRGCKP